MEPLKVNQTGKIELQGKRVLVIGMGISGRAAVHFLCAAGAAKVLASDNKQSLAGELADLKSKPAVELHLGVQLPELADSIDLVVKSPGVPPGLPPLKRARELNVPVLTEVELAYHYINCPLIGVTGTNGKTTTTSLLGQIMQAGRPEPVYVAGNIGTPLLAIAGQVTETGLIVAELSSFQLEDTYEFHPWISLVLNITPDHLNYHGSMEAYTAAKRKILSRQHQDEFAVLNADDAPAAAFAADTRAQVWLFSRRQAPGGDIKVGLVKGIVTAILNGKTISLLPAEEIRIPGAHNLENAMAAATAALAAGIAPEVIARVLRSFPGVEHRLEPVAEINGVTYVNDSKGTNPESTLKALEAFPGPVILLAGGYDKGSDFTSLAEHFAGHVRHLILLGETREKIARTARSAGLEDITMVADLKEGVETARRLARPGDTVLLSPACASWDMFNNYEERGNQFKNLVLSLQKGEG